MNNTIILGKLEFTVASEMRKVDGKEELVYVLTGKRGAKYFTMRNVHSPHMMFLCNGKKFGMAPCFEGTWLTDKNGKLELV